MFKKILLSSALLLGAASAANAEVVAGIGYSNLSDGGIDLGAVTASAGYQFDVSPGFAFTTEARYTEGVSGDSGLKLDNAYGVSARGQFAFNDKSYAFIQPSYTNSKISGFGVSADSWDFGVGAGVGYKFNENVGAELAYERVDDVDVVTAGLRLWLK